MKRQKLKNVSNFYSKLSDTDDESADETELFTRNKQRNKEIKFIEKVVEEGDTLQSLSIKYRCSIAELKRLNNIHKENEIFARRYIKVPDRPFSAALAAVHISGTSSPNNENSDPLKKEVDIETLNKKLSFSQAVAPEVNNIIFNSNLYAKPCDNPEIDNDIDEETNLLGEHRSVVTDDAVVTKLSCSGADCDISWIALIVCVVIVIFALPVIYVVYIAEHFEEYHHNHSLSS